MAKDEFISTKLIQKKFQDFSKDNVANIQAGSFYSKKEVDGFLTEVSLEIKEVEDYVFSIHSKNQNLEKEVRLLNDKLKQQQSNHQSNSAPVSSASTIDKIISYAETEAAELKEKAQKTSDNIISQGRKQAAELVQKATEQSQAIRAEAAEHLEMIEQYRESMDNHQEEYNKDIKLRSQKIKQIAEELNKFATEVEQETKMSFGPDFTKKAN